VAVFVLGFLLSPHRKVGYTTLIRFGSRFDAESLDTLKKVPHVILPRSAGYDGQFYAQLALSPALNDPQLPYALDSPVYRSRRILFSWTAWALGLGKPAWVIRAYAVQNLLFWVGAAILLWRWLPPTRWFHFFQWAAILFSRGWMDSLSNALLDGPALFLMLLAIWLSERQRTYWGTALLGVSVLGKETNLLGGLALRPEFRLSARSTKEVTIWALLLVLPMALWLAVIYFKFGLRGSAGGPNFSRPFVGWYEKIQELRFTFKGADWSLGAQTVACVISTLAQITYFATARKWSEKWWRMGAPYAVLGVCLGIAVLRGNTGAFSRALLPMLAAYNLSLKPTRIGWLLLVVGNLHVLPGLDLMGKTWFPRFWN
jgi:hypothetical protein